MDKSTPIFLTGIYGSTQNCYNKHLHFKLYNAVFSHYNCQQSHSISALLCSRVHIDLVGLTASNDAAVRVKNLCLCLEQNPISLVVQSETKSP
jgi:hypothetical protein